MRGKVGTWVNSQWKYQATPGQFSVAINIEKKETVFQRIVAFVEKFKGVGGQL